MLTKSFWKFLIIPIGHSFLHLVSDEKPLAFCSLVGSLNKIPISIAGILLFKVPLSLPNLFSILFGNWSMLWLTAISVVFSISFGFYWPRCLKNKKISGLFAGVFFARAKMSWLGSEGSSTGMHLLGSPSPADSFLIFLIFYNGSLKVKDAKWIHEKVWNSTYNWVEVSDIIWCWH